MAAEFSEQEWRDILSLAEAVADLPAPERLKYLESVSPSSETIREVLTLVHQFDPPKIESDRVGTRNGRFLITRYIGRGGMGEVFAAQDTELQRTVALKFIHQDIVGQQRAAENFVREARTASALNHSNIVTIHEVIRSEKTTAIVMEFVEGTPLRDLCGTPLPPTEITQIGVQIAHALAAAHAAGIVHCDIKPENVIVRPDGNVKVLDFGLARSFMADDRRTGSASHSGILAGTWRYMSPEQIRGEIVTSATDIFSLGLLLYELSVGQPAFSANSGFDAMQAVVTQTPDALSKLNPAVPAALDALILTMLAKAPSARPRAEAVALMLSSVKDNSGLAPNRQRYRLKIWMAVLLLTGALGAVWFWKTLKTAEPPPAFYQLTTLVPENRATAAVISPDGRVTAFANVDGVFARSMQSGETSLLHVPQDLMIDKLEWFSDGTKLLASGFSTTTNVASVWVIPITGAPPRLLRSEAGQAVPSPDGARVAFIRPNQSSIWVMGSSGEDPRQVVSGPAGDTFPFVFWSANGRRLSFQRRHYSGIQDLGLVMLDYYSERSYESVDVETGAVTAKVKDFWMDSSVVLADDRLLFLRWEIPHEDYINQLWEVKTNPLTGGFIESPRRISLVVRLSEGNIHGLSASGDGKLLMVLRPTNQESVFVGDFEPLPPRILRTRRLTLDTRSSYPHAWTADSRAVIFESDRNGNWDIFKQRLDQRVPESLAASPSRSEVLPQLTPDGRSVLYAAGSAPGQPGPYGLMRVPVDGGTPEQVPIGGALDEYRCSLGSSGRCVVRNTSNRQRYIYSDLDPVGGKGRELARTAWQPSLLWDWDVSPDGSEVAIPNHDLDSARIRLVPLTRDGRPGTELVLEGLRNLIGLVWAADGQGWFVVARNPLGKRLLFVSRDGRWRPLGDIQGWGVPSPDGHHVAFVNPIVATNAWIIDRRGTSLRNP